MISYIQRYCSILYNDMRYYTHFSEMITIKNLSLPGDPEHPRPVWELRHPIRKAVARHASEPPYNVCLSPTTRSPTCSANVMEQSPKQTLVEIWLISFPGKQIGKNPCLKKRSKLWQTTRHICSNHAPEVCGELQGANVAECHWIATCRTWQNKGQPGPLCQVIVILLLGERVAHKRGNTYSKQLAPQFLWNI